MSVVSDMQQDKGLELIDLLGLKVKANGRVNTSWGDKSDMGLYLTVKRFIEESEAAIKKEDEIVAQVMDKAWSKLTK